MQPALARRLPYDGSMQLEETRRKISDSSGGTIAYRASKAALNMIMHAVAKDWARDGVLVGILHPGWVKTDMGGPSAPLDVVQSITGLRARIAELSARTSGRFIDYAGAEIGW